MKEKFLSWQGTKRRELFLSCCGFDSYISFVGKKLLSAFGTVYRDDVLSQKCFVRKNFVAGRFLLNRNFEEETF